MEWVSEYPKVNGYYWIKTLPDYPAEIVLVKGDFIYFFGWQEPGRHKHLAKWSKFCGPIVRPPLPVDESVLK